jgi:hypothetical protein
MSNLATVDAFPCRVLHRSRHQNSLVVATAAKGGVERMVIHLLRSHWVAPAVHSLGSALTLVKQDDELVIKPEAVAPNVNYADWPLLCGCRRGC